MYLSSGALPVDLSLSASDEPPVEQSALDERQTVGTDEADGADEINSSAPGFGIGAALTALGAVGYAFGRQAHDNDHE